LVRAGRRELQFWCGPEKCIFNYIAKLLTALSFFDGVGRNNATVCDFTDYVNPSKVELLTTSAHELVWVKGTELHEKIRGPLGQSPDDMGNVQWIGHVLKRLQLIDHHGANIMSAASSTPSNGVKCWI
jgi:hypothetical protein